MADEAFEVPAQFKKQNGTLTSVLGNGAASRSILWKGEPNVSVQVSDITNLQQTPATAAKASIRITAKDHQIITFTFTSASARDDQQAVTSKLRRWIELSSAPAAAGKAATPQAPKENGSGQSASMTMAQTVAGVPAASRAEEEAYDDAKLMRDVELQRSLLNTSPALRQRFDQALRDKPDSISIAQFATQFWATRIHLLRSHAAEKAQGHGTYNVLSVIKSHQVDGKEHLSITKEQIQLIFAQHPLVKRVYNDLVPQIKEGDFWSRFFTTRLIKKLKGEKITDLDPVDAKFDKYLDYDDDDGQARQLHMDIVPRFIDVEGNEQNHSQRQGNRPDWTMQPNHYDKVPILRTLNRMSEKMMADVPPSDLEDRHAPAGMDEQTYKELQLRDLQLDGEDNRVVLKIKDQAQLFAAEQGLQSSSSASTYAKRTPTQVLSLVHNDFNKVVENKSSSGGLNLESALGVEGDSSSEEEGMAKKKIKVGSRSARSAATTQIIKAIKKRQLHNDDFLSYQKTTSSEQAAKLGLSQSVFDTLCMTHNTTVEFLHYFWTVYYSGDPDRASEVARLIETLEKSLDRIKAVADSAEAERAAKIEQTTRDYEAYTKRTGKKKRFDPNNVEGGAKAVNKVVGPLVRAIRSAKEHFEKALHEQLAQAAASVNKLPDTN